MNRFIKSLFHAMDGIGLHWKIGKNFRIQGYLALLVILAGLLFNLSPWEWAAILLSIGIVLALESINSAIEVLCDTVSPRTNPSIKSVKDLVASGVLLFCIVATILAGVIFIPKIIGYLTA